jgi:hypothetical protein
MRRSRDNREGTPAYEQWKVERAAEIAAEQAADPEFQFKQAANAEAEANRRGVLTMPMNEEYLKTFGTVVHPPFDESKVAFIMDKFKNEYDYVSSRGNAHVLVDFLDRNNLSPASLESFKLAHAILKLWNCYEDTVAPVEVAPVVVDTRTPSEIAEEKYKTRMTEIVVYDPHTNIGYTEFDLENKVDSKTELRLRRLMEGKIGNELYTEYMNRKNWQAARDAEIARLAAEES